LLEYICLTQAEAPHLVWLPAEDIVRFNSVVGAIAVIIF
jgi:hypothetical protein